MHVFANVYVFRMQRIENDAIANKTMLFVHNIYPPHEAKYTLHLLFRGRCVAARKQRAPQMRFNPYFFILLSFNPHLHKLCTVSLCRSK